MNHELIKGELVSLRPFTNDDRDIFFKWATQSDGTSFWYGEEFNDPIPSKEKFFEDFTDIYFDGTKPEVARSYAIICNKNRAEIGQINYQINDEVEDKNVYDFDIIIAEKANFGKGFGNAALKLLTEYVKQNLNPNYMTIYVDPNNPRALKSYSKVGFEFDAEVEENNVKWLRMVLK